MTIPADRWNIALRPPTEGDRDDRVRIYEASREIELAMVPWDIEQKREFAVHQLTAQTTHYGEYYPHATESIIELDGETAGRVYIDRGPDQIAILDMTVLPEYRRRGVASQIVRTLQAEAGQERSIRVFVEVFNTGGAAFFSGHGFVPVSQDGMSVRFEWRRVN